MSKNILQLKNVCRNFNQGSEVLKVLQKVNLEIKPKEVVALIGPSGSGKSTLLQIAGLLDRPTSGEIILNGSQCSKASDFERTLLRRDYLGFVYQYHNLLPDFDAAENVILPQLIAGITYKEAKDKAGELSQKELKKAAQSNAMEAFEGKSRDGSYISKINSDDRGTCKMEWKFCSDWQLFDFTRRESFVVFQF